MFALLFACACGAARPGDAPAPPSAGAGSAPAPAADPPPTAEEAAVPAPITVVVEEDRPAPLPGMEGATVTLLTMGEDFLRDPATGRRYHALTGRLRFEKDGEVSELRARSGAEPTWNGYRVVFRRGRRGDLEVVLVPVEEGSDGASGTAEEPPAGR